MRIQLELYKSYNTQCQNLLWDSQEKSRDTEEEPKDLRATFLPSQLTKKIGIDYSKFDYYKTRQFSTMTENFVMRIPKNLTRELHE